MLPIDEVQKETLRMNDIGLGKKLYSKKQLDDCTAFQDSQGTRKTAEMVYKSRNDKEEWGLTLGVQAQRSMIYI
jgi:hypothetical protein